MFQKNQSATLLPAKLPPLTQRTSLEALNSSLLSTYLPEKTTGIPPSSSPLSFLSSLCLPEKHHLSSHSFPLLAPPLSHALSLKLPKYPLCSTGILSPFPPKAFFFQISHSKIIIPPKTLWNPSFPPPKKPNKRSTSIKISAAPL